MDPDPVNVAAAGGMGQWVSLRQAPGAEHRRRLERLAGVRRS